MRHIKCDFQSKACVSLGWTLGVGSKGHISTFSDYGHVAYQIKENRECSNMVALFCLQTFDTPMTLGIGSLGQNSTFSEHCHVAYQFKGNHEMQQHGSKYFARRPPSPPL